MMKPDKTVSCLHKRAMRLITHGSINSIIYYRSKFDLRRDVENVSGHVADK